MKVGVTNRMLAWKHGCEVSRVSCNHDDIATNNFIACKRTAYFLTTDHTHAFIAGTSNFLPTPTKHTNSVPYSIIHAYKFTLGCCVWWLDFR